MTDISPTAQVVLDAVYRELDYANEQRRVRWVAAAALRAVALEVVLNKYQYADWQMADIIMKEIQDIATELENAQ